MGDVKIRYGLRDGKLISIDEVERGLKCDCICPACKAPLEARKGKHRSHYFAHASNTSCRGGAETALHIMAKNLLYTFRSVYLPDIDKSNAGIVKQYDSAELECRDYPAFIPDVILKCNDSTLGVEILVTHAVDDEKQEKIKEAELPTIEIDLSDQIEYYTAESVIYDSSEPIWELLYKHYRN